MEQRNDTEERNATDEKNNNNEKHRRTDLFRRYVGYRIRRARHNAGIGRKDLKGGKPYAYNTINIWERGVLNRHFNDANIERIAAFFRITPEELLGASSLTELDKKIRITPEIYLGEYVEEGGKHFRRLDGELMDWYAELDLDSRSDTQ